MEDESDSFWDLNSQASHAKADDWDDNKSEVSEMTHAFSALGTEVKSKHFSDQNKYSF